MALLLLSLGLSVIAAQEFNPRIVVQRNYNMARVSGVWYSIFMASDDLNRIKENGDLRVFVRNIEHLKNGNLKFDFEFMVQGECVAVVVVCEKTEKNEEYFINYEGENTVAVSETDYRLFITFHLQNFRNGTKTHALALYARVPQLEPSFLSRFEETCKKYGLGPQNIINLTNEDHCYSKRYRSPSRPPLRELQLRRGRGLDGESLGSTSETGGPSPGGAHPSPQSGNRTQGAW
ncbi:epididymal-specific lipocalin-9 [Trachypithecus francoisi]|uniref:epididymal-specific lipocalin-9 n=1 Tax=Trachypithecus francoisi TaxID=54180 RepID=UPI00141AD097|nr:epididymal-specific lipocalin-9 [Trachypithecus francoisi]